MSMVNRVLPLIWMGRVSVCSAASFASASGKALFVSDSLWPSRFHSSSAMWGACGTALGHTAHGYLMTAPIIETMPISFVREARRELRTLLETHDRIEGEVAIEYLAAQRFLDVLGFEFGETFQAPCGKFRPFFLEQRPWV